LLILIEIILLEGKIMVIIDFFIVEYKWIIGTLILIGGLSIALFQLKSIKCQLKANSLHQIQANDREIKKLRFDNPNLFEKEYNDMKLSIKNKIFLKEWEKVKDYMPSNFRKYVDSLKP